MLSDYNYFYMQKVVRLWKQIGSQEPKIMTKQIPAHGNGQSLTKTETKQLYQTAGTGATGMETTSNQNQFYPFLQNTNISIIKSFTLNDCIPSFGQADPEKGEGKSQGREANEMEESLQNLLEKLQNQFERKQQGNGRGIEQSGEGKCGKECGKDIEIYRLKFMNFCMAIRKNNKQLQRLFLQMKQSFQVEIEKIYEFSQLQLVRLVNFYNQKNKKAVQQKNLLLQKINELNGCYKQKIQEEAKLKSLVSNLQDKLSSQKENIRRILKQVKIIRNEKQGFVQQNNSLNQKIKNLENKILLITSHNQKFQSLKLSSTCFQKQSLTSRSMKELVVSPNENFKKMLNYPQYHQSQVILHKQDKSECKIVNKNLSKAFSFCGSFSSKKSNPVCNYKQFSKSHTFSSNSANPALPLSRKSTNCSQSSKLNQSIQKKENEAKTYTKQKTELKKINRKLTSIREEIKEGIEEIKSIDFYQ